MTDQLQQDLNTLSDTVPLLAKGVSSALQEAQSLENAATELLQEIAEARQETSVHLSKLRDALPALAQQLDEDEKRLVAAGDEAEKAWSAAREALTAAEQRLETEADELLASRGELHQAVAEAGTKVDQSTGIGDAAVDRIEQESQESRKELETAADAVTEEVKNLKDFLGVAESSMSAASDALLKRITELAQRLEQEATKIVEDLDQKFQDHFSAVKDTVDDLIQTVDDGVKDAAERSEDKMTTPIGEAGLELRTELERISAAAEKQDTTLRQQDQAFDQALLEAEGEASVVPEGIRQIEAASQALTGS
jgi:hypothetical protein